VHFFIIDFSKRLLLFSLFSLTFSVNITGSEFDEMFVGVGARRVRDLFSNINFHIARSLANQHTLLILVFF
jgi:hypothetical protein